MCVKIDADCIRHNKSTAVEGENMYFERSEPITRFAHRLYSGKRDRARSLLTADDVVLPNVESEEALQALAEAKEAQKQQQEAAHAAHIQQIIGGFGLMDSDSDDDDD